MDFPLETCTLTWVLYGVIHKATGWFMDFLSKHAHSNGGKIQKATSCFTERTAVKSLFFLLLYGFSQ